MSRRLSICLVLSVFAIGSAYGQTDIKAAARNTWHVAGPFSTHYYLPIDEGDSTQPGAFAVTFSPEVLWFPLHGLGIGVEASIDYSAAQFTDFSMSIGPRVAYHLTRPKKSGPSGIWLLPFVGCSFQYVMNDVDTGVTDSGWRLKLGFGISPLIGTHGTFPIELGVATEKVRSGNSENQESTSKGSRIYLEVGFGAFLWSND